MHKIVLSLALLIYSNFSQSQSKSFDFTVSESNLLFTTVEINNHQYEALIDFADFSTLQLSDRLITTEALTLTPSDIMMADAEGNQFALQQGALPEIQVGDVKKENVAFYSSSGEIEAVSQQVGHSFDVVLGAGFFSSGFTLDMKKNRVTFNPQNDQTQLFNQSAASLNTDYGYLIVSFKDSHTLLFDTGSPVSQIDNTLQQSDAEDTKVELQGFEFPAKAINLSSDLTFHAEPMDISHIKPLGVSGIFGVNDMKGKLFYFAVSEGNLYIM